MTNLRPHLGGMPSRSRVLLGAAAAGMALAGCAPVDRTPASPADDRVYLATHDGLFRYDESGPVRVGPVIDLMGFTVAGPDHFYASGHPGPGVELPEPVGLIESRDGGATWDPLSRQASRTSTRSPHRTPGSSASTAQP